jgi:peroxiredoxin
VVTKLTTLRFALSITAIVLVVIFLLAPYFEVFDETSTDDQQYRTIYKSESLGSGALAPDFKLKNLEGELVSLKDFRGKLVLLNLWATWCPPCLAELPAFERLNQKFKDKDFVIVAVAEDQPEQLPAIKEIVEKNGLSFVVLHDETMSLAEKYGSTGFPESFFINAQGNFVKVLDPESGQEAIRLISDRPWDSEVYVNLINNILEKQSDSRNN